MAKKYIAGSTGTVTLPTGCGFDCASFEVDESQASESVAVYGTAIYDPWLGSGTPHQSITAGGFAAYGATGTNPGFGIITASSSGGAATFGYATGVTLAGNYLVSRIRTTHRRLGPSVPIMAQLEGSSDCTSTWAVS